MNEIAAGTVLGIVPVIPTPFTSREEIDTEALGGLIEFAVRAGAPAACLPAYGSEFYKLAEQERFAVVQAAVRQSSGRIKIMAQANHGSASHAAELARQYEALGAGLISFALPRQFALSEDDLLRCAARVAGAVKVPVLVQDFNPGGASVGAGFACRLLEAASNFRYLKLEEPQMGAKVRAIHDASAGRVGVLEGWGGMYVLELTAHGIAGAMPGLALCDLFVKVFDLARAGDLDAAMEIHRAMLPQIVFALQNMELFHHCEKRLLAARGVLRSVVVREPTVQLDRAACEHLDALNRVVLAELARQGLT